MSPRRRRERLQRASRGSRRIKDREANTAGAEATGTERETNTTELTGAQFLADLGERAPAEIANLVRRIESLLAPYDAFDWLAHLFLGNSIIDADNYKESTFAGLSAVVEFGACQLITRSTRAGTGGDRLINGPIVQECVDSIRSFLRWASMRQMAVAGIGSPGRESIRYAVLGKRMYLRHPRLEHQERRILDELFAEPFEEELRAEVGFSIDEAVRVIDVFRALPLRRLQARVQEATEMAVLAKLGDRPPANQLRTIFRKLPEPYRNASFAMTWHAVGDTIALTVADIAKKSGLRETVVMEVLTRFTIEFGYRVPDGADWVDGFIAGYNPVLQRPIVHDGAGHYLCIGPGLVFFALQDVLSGTIKDERRRDALFRRRSKFVETFTSNLLGATLRPDLLELNLHYLTEDGVAETDVLITLGPVALIVENKSAQLSEAGRRAAPKSLPEELTAIITDGVRQAERVRSLVEKEGGLRAVYEDGNERWVDLRHINRIVPIVVTLEDLSWISSTVEHLIEAGLVADEKAPLSMSIHDLEIMCELVEWPAQLIHFLERRYRANRLRAIAAADELDFFMYYMKNGLYFDEVLNRTDGPDHVLITSMTDDLDAYYMYKHGQRRRPAPKPTQPMHRLMRRTLRQLDATRFPGWLEASLALLDMDGEGRGQFGEFHHLVRRKARDGRFHDASWQFADGGITLMSSPPAASTALRGRLEKYCLAKRHQQKVRAWFGFGVVEGDDAPFRYYACSLPPYPPDHVLERLCDDIGLGRS